MVTSSSNPPTPPSLLQRLRTPDDGSAWDRFAELYTPLLFYWARRAGLAEADAADLVQEVFALLVRKLPAFEYRDGGSFRSWLRTVLLNKWRELRRQKQLPLADGVALDDLPGEADPLDGTGVEELVRRALELLRPEFEPATWEAFRQTAMLGRPARTVATELGLSPNAVYVARSRVFARLRRELEGLI